MLEDHIISVFSKQTPEGDNLKTVLPLTLTLNLQCECEAVTFFSERAAPPTEMRQQGMFRDSLQSPRQMHSLHYNWLLRLRGLIYCG